MVRQEIRLITATKLGGLWLQITKHLKQGLANYDPLPVFIDVTVLEHRASLIFYIFCLWLFSFYSGRVAKIEIT